MTEARQRHIAFVINGDVLQVPVQCALPDADAYHFTLKQGDRQVASWSFAGPPPPGVRLTSSELAEITEPGNLFVTARPEWTPKITPTAYVVNLIPDTYPDRSWWTIRVEQRNTGRWSVMCRGRVFSKADAEADRPEGAYEPLTMERTKKFERAYQFSHDKALTLAKRLARKVVANGMTAEQYMSWYARTGGLQELAAAKGQRDG